MTRPELSHPPLTELGEEERMFRETARAFAEQEIRPLVAAMDAEARLDPGLLRRLFEMGFMAIDVPVRWGGTGASFFAGVIVIEELSRVDPSVGVVVDVQNTLVNTCIRKYGNEEQRERWLPRLAADVVGAYALSEAHAGSDAFALETRAREDGDNWRLTGRKLWITNGAEAGLFVVFANCDPERGYRGITPFLVERETPGVSIGRQLDKLGIRASSTIELVLDDCAVPRANVLGEIGQGYKVAIETLNEGRIGIGAQMVGLAAGALAHTIRYVREREQFGRPIGDFQGVQFQLAEMRTRLEAARLMVYNAARLREAGRPFLVEAAMAKLYASETAQWIASRCVDLHGGYGFTREYPVEKSYRDAKVGTIYEGTSNMQLQTIGKYILGAPG